VMPLLEPDSWDSVVHKNEVFDAVGMGDHERPTTHSVNHLAALRRYAVSDLVGSHDWLVDPIMLYLRKEFPHGQ
jgi:hypothetical protein